MHRNSILRLYDRVRYNVTDMARAIVELLVHDRDAVSLSFVSKTSQTV